MNDFVIYRPEKPSGRLEGTYYRDSKGWKPSLSYKHTLSDIRNQFTPSENFRNDLVTSGKLIRAIQRLDRRIAKNVETFTKAATKVQALFRGIQGREYYKKVKENLKVQMMYRETRSDAIAKYKQGLFSEAIERIDKLDITYTDLLEIKLKSFFQLKEFKHCIDTSNRLIILDSKVEDAYYLKASSYALIKDFNQAYVALKALMTEIDTPHDCAFQLFATVAVKLKPPLFIEAIDSYDTLIRRNQKDFDSMYLRACCYSCIQEWYAALKDVEFVLIFQPDNIKAIMLRAKIKTCIRKWDEAAVDYNEILNKYNPNYQPAKDALRNLETSKDIELPMLSGEILADES